MTAPRELSESVYDEFERQLDAEDAAQVLDWDTYWAGKLARQVKPVRIRGVVITPPTDAPIRLLKRLDQVQASENENDIRSVLADIVGVDVYDRWVDNGMGIVEMQVVLAWVGAHMRGAPVSFDEAFNLYQQAAAEQGKARPKPPKPKKGRSRRR